MICSRHFLKALVKNKTALIGLLAIVFFAIVSAVRFTSVDAVSTCVTMELSSPQGAGAVLNAKASEAITRLGLNESHTVTWSGVSESGMSRLMLCEKSESDSTWRFDGGELARALTSGESAQITRGRISLDPRRFNCSGESCNVEAPLPFDWDRSVLLVVDSLRKR